MSVLHEEIAEAEARVSALKRQLASEPCAAHGCDMQFYGGASAGCGDGCNCSVSVHVCSKCGDCDYGDNAEAIEIRRQCAEART